MDREPDAVRVESPFARPREPRIIVALAAAFLILALLKPWSFPESGGTGGGSAVPDSTPSGSTPALGVRRSEATATPITDPNAMDCLSDGTEQVVILERWPGNEVRSWVAAEDATASGPLDKRLAPMSVFSTHTVGLGICAPRSPDGSQEPAARFLDVELIVQTSGVAHVIDVGVPTPITLRRGGSDAAFLYGAPVAAIPGASSDRPPSDPTATSPPPSQTGGLVIWPEGSYAIGFRFPSAASNDIHWLRIDLIRGAGSAG